ncbi:MAG: hypothetical protein IT328_11120 [Caldilineaceae bacterium]|nr:hypothetical protein [Caldilineaceae bacterium]
MNRKLTSRILLAGIALLLLLSPLFVRSVIWGLNNRPYAVGQVPITSVAATPVPTSTPAPLVADSMLLDTPLRPGPVVVDLAHGNRLTRSQFEPLAAALARRGVGTRFWLSNVDVLSLTNYLDFPDQSETLAPLLEDATALVVVSPFFLWTKDEIALVERFVADGGHLLMISDPDVVGDLAQDINTLGEPFGVVYNDDYLYDTTTNDGNYTFIFPDDYRGEAERLATRRIAFYGARSIGGEVTPLLRSAHTTLSSIRSGLTNFTTMALGGLESRGTLGGVLALSDFDVLTNSYVERHDNHELVEFVAGFLAAAQRKDTITDFPAYLGKEVALIFGNAEAVDAQILLEGARLQRSLELTGRSLRLAGSDLLTTTLSPGSVPPNVDLIALADYAMIDDQTSLLRELGFRRVEVTPTPEATIPPTPTSTETVTATVTPTATPSLTDPNLIDPEENESSDETSATTGAAKNDSAAGGTGDLSISAQITPSETVTPTGTITPDLPLPTKSITGTITPEVTGAPETPTPSPTPFVMPTPEQAPVVYLERMDGLRLVARQTVIIAQLSLGGQHRIVAVLGHDNAGIQNGVERLMSGDYTGCLTGADLVVCSFEGSPEPTPMAAPAQSTTVPSPSTEGTPAPDATPAPGPSSPEGSSSILIVDDNDNANPNDASEADTYLLALTQAGYSPTLWSTADQDLPPTEEVLKYRWVIWSSGGYENGGPGVSDLEVLYNYINNGGWLTVSSRRPFFAMSREDASVIVDVVVENGVPELVKGLPSETIELGNGLPPVIPLVLSDETNSNLVALRRGPNSGDAGAPLLFVATDEGSPDATGARLMVLGMALTWLPDGYDIQLVQNMADVMMVEK